MQFYIIYIIVITLLLLADYFFNAKGKITLVLLWFVIVVSGIREDVGYDFANYISFYKLENANEPGFNLINKILNLLGLDYHSMFILYSAATLLLTFQGIKQYTQHTNIAFLIYLLIPGLYLTSFGIVRQAIAIAILFYAYSYLCKKQWLKYSIIVLISTSIHYSSLVAVPFFILSLNAKKLKWWAYGILIVGSIILSKINIISLVFQTVLGSTGFVAYASYEDGGTNFLKVLVFNGFVVVLLLFYKKMTDFNKTMFFFTALGVAFVTIFSSVGAITRFSYYFTAFQIVLIADMIYLIKNKGIRITVLVFVFMYYFAMFFSALSFDASLDLFPKITPYKTMFEK